MEQILSISWYEFKDFMVVILLCFLLPIIIVALVMSARKRSEELKTQRYLAALEKGQKPEDALVRDDLKKEAREEVRLDVRAKEKRSARDQFQGGCIVGLIGLAFIIINLVTKVTEWITLIPGAIMLAVGLGNVLTFFISKKYKLDE